MDYHLQNLPERKFSTVDLEKSAQHHLSTAISRTKFSPPRSGGRASFLETGVGSATLVLLHLLYASSPLTYPRDWRACVAVLDRALHVSIEEKLSEDGTVGTKGRNAR